ncbi:RDD family protein [Xanthomonas arboricola]|uniref:RDD family protein n=1 Tax=Xanthomonas arboricola TaxID=56448 RepID=UPI000E1FAFDE|nr:RDD family protein [Xanthomonas arboricola]
MGTLHMEQYWYAQENGASIGATRTQAQAWFDEGRIRSDTLMWTAGMEGWKPYACCSLSQLTPPSIPDVTLVATPVHTGQADGVIQAARNFDANDFLATIGRPQLALPADAPLLHVYADGWQDIRAHPWRRYFARAFDILALGLLLWFSIGIVVGTVSPPLYSALVVPVSTKPLLSGILTTLLLMPVLAIWIGLCGSTPGKWLFGIRVLRADGYALGFADALRREGRVFVFGMAMGVPLISTITQLFALVKLINAGKTSWDMRSGWMVTHRPTGRWQVTLYVVAGIASVALVALMRWIQ